MLHFIPTVDYVTKGTYIYPGYIASVYDTRTRRAIAYIPLAISTRERAMRFATEMADQLDAVDARARQVND